MPRTLRIATRQSPLALWQANHIRQQLLLYWPKLNVELLPLVTQGDRFLQDKLTTIGGKSLFVKELEEAILDGRADLAVHSMKDVPVNLPEGLILTAICKRENPRDAFLSINYKSLSTLPPGATIGTSSLRRQSQLLALRPDLIIHPLRGNIHTRIQALTNLPLDAIILAQSGLERMELTSLIKETLPDDIFLPACGQGALGIECHVNNYAVQELLAPLNDNISSICVTSERLVNQHLGGHCHAPIAIYCEPIQNNSLYMRAKVSSSDGKTILYHAEKNSEQQAKSLAVSCAESLLAQGAAELLMQS